MAVHRRSNLVRAKSDRQNLWIGIGITPTTIVGGQVSILASLNAAALAFRPFTIVRTRMLVSFQSDQAAVSEQPMGALGGIVISEEAEAAGATSVPDPSGDSDGDWFVWQPVNHAFNFLTAAGFEAPSNNQYMVDSKSMRKVGNNKQVSFVFEETNSVGAVIALTGRMLLKLH